MNAYGPNDESTLQVSKIIRILAIVALALSALNLLITILSAIITFLPFGAIAAIVSTLLIVIECILILPTLISGALALVRSLQLNNMLKAYPNGDTKKKALEDSKLGLVCSVSSFALTIVSCALLLLLCVARLVLSWL